MKTQGNIQQEKILGWNWSALPHSPYSADLEQSDFHLFPSLQNALNGKNFSQDHMKTLVENFLIKKPAEFYLRGINCLPDKWQEMIKNNSLYTIDGN